MRKTRLGSIAVIMAMIVGGIGWLFAQTPREDRPAMIVRNGSIILENEKAGGQAAPPNWVYSDGLTFTTDQQNGKPVISADATVLDAQDTPTCDLKRGVRFTIRYQEGSDVEEIHLIAAGQ